MTVQAERSSGGCCGDPAGQKGATGLPPLPRLLIKPLWKVVGGEDTGGILVRTGYDRSSAKAPTRLATGAFVRKLGLMRDPQGDRLHFETVLGSGPREGWLTTKVHSKVLAQQITFVREPAPSDDHLSSPCASPAASSEEGESDGDDGVGAAPAAAPVPQPELQQFWRRWADLYESHVRLPAWQRRLRSWAFAIAVSLACMQLNGLMRRGTEDHPLLIWVLGATASVEGALAKAGVFDLLSLLDVGRCDVVLWGHASCCCEVSTSSVRVHSSTYSAWFEYARADLIAIFMPEVAECADGCVSMSRALLPEFADRIVRSAPVVVSTRFCCSSGGLLSLEKRLKGKALFVMQRNAFSTSAGGPGVHYDDNGWITCVNGFAGLESLLEAPCELKCQDLPRGEDRRCTPFFWGIFDLKYDEGRPISERIQLLETGDGRKSQFSHDGAPITQLFRERYRIPPSHLGQHAIVSGNKKLTHDLIGFHGYGNLLPRQAYFLRHYDSHLAGRICSELFAGPDDVVVLKLLTRSRGAGVLPVRVAELDRVLQDILVPPADLQAWFEEQLAVDPVAWVSSVEYGCYEEHVRHWWSNGCPYFVAQRCCYSMPTLVGGKRYDGTMRVAFALRWKPSARRGARVLPTPDDLDVDWLGGYWKLPYDDMDSATVRKRVVSAARGAGTASVSKTQLFEIFAALGHLPQCLFNGNTLDIFQLPEFYHQEPAFAAYVIAKFALTDSGTSNNEADDREQFHEVLNLSKQVLLKVDDQWAKQCVDSYLYRVYGTIDLQHSLWGPSQNWLLMSLDCTPTNATALYLLGMAALKLNDADRACNLMRRSLLLDPDYKAAYVNLGAACLREEHYAEAVAVSRMLLIRFPDTRASEYNLGVAAYQHAFRLQVEDEEAYFLDAEFQDLRQCAYDMLSKCCDLEPLSWRPEDAKMLRSLQKFYKLIPSLQRSALGARLREVKLPLETAGWVKNHWRT